ncbi:hypothetical protein PB2503_13239 [Parvularcula bermudensis HTCC2503]|uniref:Uncharacterized protein n=1 Tax=Parvularcula bermudensis (strain ATCC BAA-594 / HTCC2503 / KCTC 12087) TaxID=314260 RepID=E0TGS6_PARBH|nr:hypothetical protein PB2503_13239 [Parvularcula bermudensis HTCC2503]
MCPQRAHEEPFDFSIKAISVFAYAFKD